MSPETQFWLKLTVQIVAALITFGAVIVALFGDWIRSKIPFLRPPLTLELSPDHTLPQTKIVDAQGNETFHDSVYFHAKVSNARRWTKVQQVEVFLIRQEIPDASGNYHTVWASELPIIWDHQNVRPLQATIGHAHTIPLCSLVKDKWVSLHPIIRSFNLKHKWEGPFKTALAFQAKGIEADSNVLRVEIAWDGKYPAPMSPLAAHLTVRTV